MHRLSFRIALGVTGALFLPALFVVGLRDAIAVSLITAIVGYGVAYIVLARPLEATRRMVTAIREHRFGDISAGHRPHDELRYLQTELIRTAGAVEKEIAEMRRLENHRREFVGNVSHELKTPIFAVQGFAETLLDGALEDEEVRRSFVEKILRNAVRLRNMARDLGEISRLETGELRLSLEGFSLERLFREVAESLEVQARERQVTVRCEVPENLPPAHADREAIRQVVLNLVDNAIKYNNPGGLVEITARESGEETLRISVVDNGIGIPAEHLSRVTERFFRVDKSRSRSQGGTGLGLSIVKHLLAAHGATLLVDSAPDRGSTFGFSLPIGRRLRRAD